MAGRPPTKRPRSHPTGLRPSVPLRSDRGRTRRAYGRASPYGDAVIPSAQADGRRLAPYKGDFNRRNGRPSPYEATEVAPNGPTAERPPTETLDTPPSA